MTAAHRQKSQHVAYREAVSAVAAARVELTDKLVDLEEKFALTYGELFSLLSTEMTRIAGSLISYERRAIRNGNGRNQSPRSARPPARYRGRKPPLGA